MINKYILYCTINKINNKIYIGVHKTQNPEEFDGYIGCGVYIHKPDTYAHPKTKFQHAVKQYGPASFRRFILQVFKNEDEAYMMESKIVNHVFLQRNDVYNMVLGGQGGSAIKARIVYKYHLDGTYWDEFISIGDAAKSIKKSSWCMYRSIIDKVKIADALWSFEKYNILDTSLYNLNPKTFNDRKIPVYQYSETGEYECCYESIRSCVRATNGDYSNINNAIIFGTKCNGKYYSIEFSSTFSIANDKKRKITIVYQYDLDGNFIKEWPSALQARKQLGFTSDIYKAIKLNRTAGNFYWSLEKLNKLNIKKPISGKAKKIGKYDKNNILIKTYDTLTEAKKENGSGLIHVLSGRDKFHKGFIYKYLIS